MIEGDLVSGRYRLGRLLGEGGAGSTYLAHDELAGHDVALKLVRSGSPELVVALLREFRLLRGVVHPSVSRVLDLGVLGRAGRGEPVARAFYTAAYIEGETLTEWAAGKDFSAVRQPLVDALEGLRTLHTLGVLHGDFKTDNIIVNLAGRGILIDLSAGSQMGKPRTSIAGTLGSLAPEALLGGVLDARADVFAIGVALTHLCNATHGAPQSVSALASRARSRDPQARPADVAEVLDALGMRSTAWSAMPSQPVALWGRASEMDHFRQRLTALQEGREAPRTLVLAGAEGVGKSRLLEEMKWQAQLSCVVAEGHATHPSPLMSMVTQAGGGAPEAIADEDVFARVARLVDGNVPTVLVLDELQALAPQQRNAWQAIVRMVGDRGNVLLLGAETVQDVQVPRATHLLVSPLTPPTVREWLDEAGFADDAQDALAITEGYPAQVVEFIAARKAGHSAGGSAGGSAGDGRGRPAERRVAELAALREPARELLACVAILGAEGLVDADSTLESARELYARSLVRVEERHIRLARPTHGELILAALAPETVMRACVAADDILRTALQKPDVPPDVSSKLAALRVVVLCMLRRENEASELAQESQAQWAERADFWRKAAHALQGGDGGPEATRHAEGSIPYLCAAEIFASVGPPDDALSALARIRRRGPRSTAWRVAIAAAKVYLERGLLRRAHGQLARARKSVPVESRAIFSELLSRVHIQSGAYRDAARVATAALSDADAVTAVTASLHDSIGVSYTYMGNSEKARQHLEVAARMHEQVGRSRSAARSLSYQALVAYRAGQTEIAAETYRAALASARRSQSPDLIANAALNVATVEHQLGDLGPALAAYERARSMSVAVDRASTTATIECNLAKLYVDIGLFERAADAAARALEHAVALGIDLVRATALAVLGELAFLRGNFLPALQSFEESRAIFVANAAQREICEVSLQEAEAYAAMGDEPRAELARKRASELALAVPAADLDARVALMTGRIARSAHREDACVAALERARERALASQQKLLLAEVEVALADTLDDGGARELASRLRAGTRASMERIAMRLSTAHREAFWAHPVRRALAEPQRAGANSPEAILRASRLEQLVAINRRLSTSLDAEEILRMALDGAMELTRADRGFVILAPAQRAAGELDVPFVRNMARTDLTEGAWKFSKTIAEQVIASGEPLVTVDARADERLAGSMSVHAMHLQAIVCAPIRGPHGVLGALYLDHRFRRGGFRDDEAELLLAFADQVAIGLKHARLVKELAVRTRELEQERLRTADLLSGQAEEIHRLTEQAQTRGDATMRQYGDQAIIGRSPAMQRMFRVLDRVMFNNVNVLIHGESGTGKEWVARAIHFGGARKNGPFIAINCGAIPESLLESELFGHVQGAFTGADRNKIGLIEAADGGTLLLDEVGEMPLSMQVKFLRVLEAREVARVGATRPKSIDVKIVCATHRALRHEVEAGRFREDLYYRIAVVELTVPPLRERLEDLPELSQHFLHVASAAAGKAPQALNASALRVLLGHRWPGNVRELQNVLMRAVVLAEHDTLTARDFDLERVKPALAVASSRAEHRTKEAAQMLDCLRATRWNVSEACQAMGIPRPTFYRKMKSYGIEAGQKARGKRPAIEGTRD
ncbi:MAG: sigma 54-interacting transcriptional regulator [Polyangiaceae bacterium]|nr:sigma 54-interacting transcriptional regulator [Polyangiaceae bacterium]